MDQSLNGHVKQANVKLAFVWYNGADALYEGEAVCYDADYGTAANVDGRRHNMVERPTITNNRVFAGVAARNYSAKTGGQFIEIYEPGSKGVKIALGVDTVIGTGLLSFTAGSGTAAGRFYTGKYLGRGSAIPRQTVTAVIEASMIGAWSLATDGVTLTVVATAGLSAGDTVVLVGGEIEDGGATVVAGKYKIASITSDTVLVLASSAITGTALGAVTCTGYAYTGNPTCQADLLDGEESGGIQFSSLPNAGGDTQTYMVGGLTYICGGLTLAADAEYELAQAVLPGEKKAFICLGTMTTSAAVVDLVSAGLQIDGSSALAEINAIDAAADAVYLQFNGAKWHCMDVAGGATQA
jgi:hypothetical protein